MEKISILGLHLNYGGVEQAIINQANMLCEDYEVELAISYKTNNEPAFKINPKVKIVYLTNVKPNKKEFIASVKNKKLSLIFKEGLKSINIIYLKFKTMKNYIKNSDSDIIISSRIEFTKLLSKYSKKNVITIAEEHCHHNNNKKYIKKIKKACNNINYLVLVSQELTNFYKKLLNNTKCIYIPNGLSYIPKEKSVLKEKKLISIGRLSPEKGFLDLIDVFNIINTKDDNFKLDIIGDGIEKEEIIKKINNYKLNTKIKLHGFQNKEYITNLLKDSSIYVMCSHEESFGIVLIEAGSYGLPSVAFDSAQGANEIIKNNKSGYLIKNRDKEDMAKKIIELFNNKKKLKEYGLNAYIVANQFSYENIKKEWLDFISKIK